MTHPAPLLGKTIVLTGANTGIGRVTAIELAARGANLLLLGRTEARHADVIRAIGSERATFIPLDLTDLDSVRAAAAMVKARAPGPLAALVNNAGLAGSRGATAQGFELAFGVNHVGHYLLTRLLLPRLLEAPGARVVSVASRAHLNARGIDYEAVRRPTSSPTALPEYAVSKLANVLFARELARRYGDRGLTSVSLHPGVVATDIWRSLPRPIEWLITLFMLTPEQGAETTVHCVTAPEVPDHNGEYFAKRAPAPFNARAVTDEAAAELWRRSALWCGVPED
ncbi:MAG: SDR family NAD(P)-dependent oxidoreductase [Myxococcales bacterium]|nr:SDR family NAD(P)-dependent oxidoreductase [Myxococcales bacterium]MCB9532297.1 SDR family NAD(P)-dependent oxidoreductase [Myxococcales bacterium]